MLQELMKIVPELKPDDIPGKMRSVAIKCGINDAIGLMDRVPGLEIYIPTSGHSIYLHDYIKAHFNGNNSLSLGVKLGIDSSKVKAIYNNKRTCRDPLTSVQLRMVADECGEEIANRLLFHFPGERIQVPTEVDFLKRKYIKKYFNGSNGPEIAIRICATDRFVRKVVSEMYEENRNPQLNLFSAAS